MDPGSSVMVSAPQHGRRVLSLDGGGVRGLSALLILRHIMKRIHPQDTPKPCEYFDLIAGTSTGGLIAIMLGRLQMSINDCILAYQNMSERVFTPKRSGLNVLGKGKDAWTLSGAFDEEQLDRVVKEIVVQAGEPADAALLEKDPVCKVFVCATRAEVNKPVRLRSYETLLSVQEVDCTIAEAARATSAASSFFKPVMIQGQGFVDGATAYNNPVEEVLEEAEQIWDARNLCFDKFLSIGTGRAGSKPFGKNLAEVARTLIRISTDTEKAAERFEKTALRHKGLSGLYFRFNAHGLENIGLEDKSSFGAIMAATNAYLIEHDTQIKLSTLSAQNVSLNLSPGQKEAYIQSLPTYDVQLELDQISHPAGDTFEWVLHSHQFKDWISCQDKPILQIRGKPGSGKSVLMASLKRKVSDDSTTIAFFACKQTQKDRRTPERILSSLLSQILIGQPKLFRYVVPRRPGFQSWSYQQLLQSFGAVLTAPDNTGILCFIDALDEAHEPSRLNLIEGLSEVFELVRRRTSAGFSRIVISSRPSVHTSFTSAITIDLDNAPEMIEDLRKFADIKIEKLITRRSGYAAHSERIHRVFEDRAAGMYRLVELVVDDLENMSSSSPLDIERTLQSLPHGISDVYDRLWASIHPSSLNRARSIMTWILFSFDPVRQDTLAEAIGVFSRRKGSRLQEVRQNIPLHLVGDIERLFGPLIRITPFVQPSHPSVRDHFLQNTSLFEMKENGEKDSENSPMGVLLSYEAHTFMALACLRYLNLEAEDDQGRCNFSGPTLKSFHSYARAHFASHVSRALRVNDDLDAEIQSFIETQMNSAAGALQQPLPHEHILGTDTFIPPVNDTLSFSSYYGRPSIIRKFRSSASAKEQLSCSRKPCPGLIIRAIYLSLISLSEECLQEAILLLDMVFLAPSQPIDFLSLTIAKQGSDKGGGSIAECEECSCSDVDNNSSSLSQQVYSQIVRAFHQVRTKNQCVDRSDEKARNLQHAILGVYRTLLNTHSDQHDFPATMDQDWTYNLALIIRIYVKETYGKASVNLFSQTEECLMEAVQSNRLQAVRILLDEGIDLRSARHGIYNESILHLAARAGNYSILQSVLDLGQLDVNIKDDLGRTPLHCACSGTAKWDYTSILSGQPPFVSRSKIVQVLLQSHADKHARDCFGHTPLQNLSRVFVPEWDDIPKTSSLNWREIDLNNTVPQLLSRLEDVVDWDKYGATPLHNASYLWPLSSIKILLSFLGTYYVSGNLLDSGGRTALHYAAIRGFDSPEKVIDALCQAGIDPRVQQLYDETALAVAKRYGRDGAVQALRRQESYFDAEAAQNFTNPWQQASDIGGATSAGYDIAKTLQRLAQMQSGFPMREALGSDFNALGPARPKNPIIAVCTEGIDSSNRTSLSVVLAALRQYSVLDSLGFSPMDYPSMMLSNQIEMGRRILRLNRPGLPSQNASIPRPMLRLLSSRIYNLAVDPFEQLAGAALIRPIAASQLTALIARAAASDISSEEALISASFYCAETSDRRFSTDTADGAPERDHNSVSINEEDGEDSDSDEDTAPIIIARRQSRLAREALWMVLLAVNMGRWIMFLDFRLRDGFIELLTEYCMLRVFQATNDVY